MTGLIVTKDTGELLFDTSKIAYGLVRTGYMSYIENWSRYTKPYTNTDPDLGSSWVVDNRWTDSIHGFTIATARSPIAFIVGRGVLVGTSRSGNSITFLYTCADTSTKFYCFDLMSDNIAGSPYLKTWNTSGEITFNSLQPPMNVNISVRAPDPPGFSWNSFRPNTYVGGWAVDNTSSVPSYLFGIDIALEANTEYAAHLPWSRGARVFSYFNLTLNTYFGIAEGAYGRVGGMSFMFGPSGASTQNNYTSAAGRPYPTIDLLPTDRYPTALIIKTSIYPFPYG